MYFTIVSEITEIETIASGAQIRDLRRLKKAYGPGRWRKKKGLASIRFAGGATCRAELHWYEAHGVGAKEYKINCILEWQI